MFSWGLDLINKIGIDSINGVNVIKLSKTTYTDETALDVYEDFEFNVPVDEINNLTEQNFVELFMEYFHNNNRPLAFATDVVIPNTTIRLTIFAFVVSYFDDALRILSLSTDMQTPQIYLVSIRAVDIDYDTGDCKISIGITIPLT